MHMQLNIVLLHVRNCVQLLASCQLLHTVWVHFKPIGGESLAGDLKGEESFPKEVRQFFNFSGWAPAFQHYYLPQLFEKGVWQNMFFINTLKVLLHSLCQCL